MIVYRIEHETRYAYEAPVATSQHVAWLEPRTLPRQVLRSYALTITPQPLRLLRRLDYFGNVVHQFELLRPHLDMRVVSEGILEIQAPDALPAPASSPAWEDVRDQLRQARTLDARLVSEFAFESPQVAIDHNIATYAQSCFDGGRPLLEGAIALMQRIHSEFTFDPTATTPATPVSKVLADRRGVCQDFAHFQIACLRAMGLAARYVSGYLLTDPPPGQARLIGADASHAWLSVFCARHGWVDLDPTNNVIAGVRHVTVAWGRDYGDVTPLRGVLLGGKEHTLAVGVSVVPLEPAGLDLSGAGTAP
jgi:transglutaminase-like putative cysteine protease